MESRKIMSVVKALGTLREELEYSDLPAQMVQIYLEVVAMGELPQESLQERTAVSKAAVSRFLNILGPGSPKEPGLRLLETFEDPEWRRRKLVRVTARGKLVAQKMIDAMGK